MDLTATFQQLGISLGLGLLVGLQRERTEPRLGGIRTFPLVTLFGTMSGQLGASFGGWIVGAALLTLAGIIVVGDLIKNRNHDLDAGLTTEVTMLLMFCVGAYLAVGQAAVAVALGGGVAVLLHLKAQMHSLAARIGDTDFQAIMQFVLITLVILPVLPDQAFGPYQVLNPHKIWLMVVLIVGMSLVGYVVYKLFGQRVGALVGGILGGLISSTATTVSYSRRVAGVQAMASESALVIAIASAVVFFRVAAIIGIVSPGSALRMGPPLGALFLLLTVCVGAMFLLRGANHSEMPPHANLTELRPAVIFALLFSAVLLAVAATQAHFGSSGLYVVAILSGLTDMDAITLSIMQMVEAHRVEVDTGWRMILAAALSNALFKAVLVFILGGRALFCRLLVFFAIALVGGLAIIWFWP